MTSRLCFFSIVVFIASTLTACAGKRPLERFAEAQDAKIHQKRAYVDADFDFWAAVYEPTSEDLERLRSTWIQHGGAFPDSKAFSEVEREVMKSSQRVVLVALFMTAFENADLRDKSLGWAVSPIPASMKELSETDVVIRTLMPVKNPWARYFLLRYSPETLSSVTQFTVSNHTSSVELKR